MSRRAGRSAGRTRGSAGGGDGARTAPSTLNVAIVAALATMPIVIATGFLSEATTAGVPRDGAASPPALRGTLQPDAAPVETARLRPTG